MSLYERRQYNDRLRYRKALNEAQATLNWYVDMTDEQIRNVSYHDIGTIYDIEKNGYVCSKCGAYNYKSDTFRNSCCYEGFTIPQYPITLLKYLIDKNFRLFLMLSAVFALGSFSYSFLLIFAKEAGLEITLIPVLYLFFMVIASAFSMYFGNLADSIGRKNVLTLSFVFWGLVCLTFILFSSTVAIVFAFLCYGLYKGAAMPVQKTFVSELAPTRYRASSLGAYKMAIGLCALPSSLIAGILWDQIGHHAPFYLSFGLTVLSLVLLFFVEEKKED